MNNALLSDGSVFSHIDADGAFEEFGHFDQEAGLDFFEELRK